jgi:hypothetical protein
MDGWRPERHRINDPLGLEAALFGWVFRTNVTGHSGLS